MLFRLQSEQIILSKMMKKTNFYAKYDLFYCQYFTFIMLTLPT